MNRPRRVRFFWAASAAVALAFALLAGSLRPGDPTLFPAPPGQAVDVFVTNNGYHSGIVVPVPTLARLAGRDGDGALIHIATRFAPFPWIEIGWGEARFYREVSAVTDFDLKAALRALFRPGNGSVLHVVGVDGDPRAVFGPAYTVRVPLSEAGLSRLLRLADASFVRRGDGAPELLGPGLYGPSLFYRAAGTFHVFNVCNHWTARLLDAAGVPTSPVLATLPLGLLMDLKWRAGLEPDGEGTGSIPLPSRHEGEPRI